MPLSLTQILDQVKANQEFANEDVDTGPLETMTGRRGRKNRAIESLKSLKGQYRTELLRSSVFILVTGGAREEFQKVATGAPFECFAADALSFYKDLAGRVNPALYEGKESVSNMLDVVSRYLEDKARELGMREYPQMFFKQEYRHTIKNKEDFISLITQVINEQVGSEVVGIQAVSDIVDVAIERGHTSTFTPVLLSVEDPNLALQMISGLNRLSSRVFLVSAGKNSKLVKQQDGVVSLKEVNEDSVGEALKTIRDSIKK